MNFVNYDYLSYIDLTNDQSQIILAANISTLYVNSITICNTSVNDIRISLMRQFVGGSSPLPASYIAKDVLVPSISSGKVNNLNTINLVKLLGLDIFLPSTTIDSESNILTCYSNGINQKFDCNVDYTTFVETAR